MINSKIADAAAQARKAERARFATVMSHAGTVGKWATASKLLTTSDMSADAIISVLATVAAPKSSKIINWASVHAANGFGADAGAGKPSSFWEAAHKSSGVLPN